MTSRSSTKRQIDYSRPLLKESSLEAFLKLDAPDATTESGLPEGGKLGNLEPRRKNTLPEAIKKPETSTVANGATNQQKGKPNIAIPSVNKVEDEATAAQKQFQADENYIRYSYVKFYPHPERYEATDYDLEFLKELNSNSSGKLKSDKNQITPEQFERIIEIWDAETDRDEPISLEKAQMVISKVLDVNAYKDQIGELYIYWKGRREAFKRPLVRKYWRTVNRDESNPNVVFRAREKQKIETRRYKKGNTAENYERMKMLRQELDISRTLIANLNLREMLKYELTGLSITKFDMQMQEKLDPSTSSAPMMKFRETFDSADKIYQKNQLRDFNKTAQKYIFQGKEEAKNPADKTAGIPLKGIHRTNTQTGTVAPTPNRNLEDVSFDIARFIALIAESAVQKDITPQKVEKLDLPSVQMHVPAPEILSPAFSRASSVLPEKIVEKVPIPTPNIRPAPQHTTITPVPIIEPAMPMPEVKNIFKYKIRKRFGRQGRVYLDKVYLDEDDIHAEFEKEKRDEHKPKKAIRPSKFNRGLLNTVYNQKFQKVEDLYPFADSDEDKDLIEFSRGIKKTFSSFKTFQKQRRSSSILA